MIPPLCGFISNYASVPRIRGDDPEPDKYYRYQILCSPHTRG
nr:MAG TPA: hypothetical protein [Caudoviricetes sp.]